MYSTCYQYYTMSRIFFPFHFENFCYQFILLVTLTFVFHEVSIMLIFFFARIDSLHLFHHTLAQLASQLCTYNECSAAIVSIPQLSMLVLPECML